MAFSSDAIICCGEHKFISEGGVFVEIEPHTVEDDFLEYDVDAQDCDGNDYHHRFTFPMAWKKPANFPDTHFLGKTLHVEILGHDRARFSLN